jgi:hypothetical protein
MRDDGGRGAVSAKRLAAVLIVVGTGAVRGGGKQALVMFTVRRVGLVGREWESGID